MDIDDMSYEERNKEVRIKRSMLLEALANEMAALERMNPKTQLANIAVCTHDRGHSGSRRDYTLATFLGMLCVESALLEYGDLGSVERVELRVT